MNTSLNASQGVSHLAQALDTSPPTSNEYKRKDSLKRSRHEFDEQVINLEPFQIRTPGSSNETFLTAQPLLLLPRTSLPLCYLDYAGGCGDSDHLPRNFAGNIQSLEGLDSEDEFNIKITRVLVTKFERLGHLYAIERVRKYVYTLCRLGAWVDLSVLQKLSGISQNDVWCASIQNGANSNEWWADTAVSVPIADHRLKRVKIIHDSRTTEHSGSLETLHGKEEVDGVGQYHEATITSATADQPNTVEEMFSTIVDKYLDMLYMSKASLAYFAKGPLSRARAAFKGVEDSTRQPYELAEFLRGLVYSSSMMDKKYKTGLTATIISILTSETPLRPKKRKKAPSFKPGKDGLLPSESEVAQRWWNNDEQHQIAGTLGRNSESFIKTKLSTLRVRENLLQLILLLEVQAIESAPNGKRPLPESSEEAEKENLEELKKPAKPKKPLDLKDVMEALVDRLTIWQSLSSEPENASARASQSESIGNASSNAPSATQNDALKDFHAQVIVPFFAARLPKVVDELGWKFGAVTTRISPNKPSHLVSKRKFQKIQSEGHIKRLLPEKTRRDLQELQSISQSEKSMEPPSLTRSATDSTLLSIKRERSSTPSGHYESKRALSRSNSISQARRLSQREVDLSAITKFNESKSKKKATVALELKEAIAALKKPNRNLAVKEYFETAESVRQPLQDRSNKPKIASTRSSVKLIEVSATPRRVSRSKDCGAAAPLAMNHDALIAEDDTSSTISFIPSSTIKPSPIGEILGSRDGHLDFSGHLGVAETPSRGPRKYKSCATEPKDSLGDVTDLPVIPASHLKPKIIPTITSSPLDGEKQQKQKRLSPAQFQSIFSTPLKGQRQTTSTSTTSKISFASAAEDLVTKKSQKGALAVTQTELRKLTTPANSSSATLTPTRSIYETLGWDSDDGNDLDELL